MKDNIFDYIDILQQQEGKQAQVYQYQPTKEESWKKQRERQNRQQKKQQALLKKIYGTYQKNIKQSEFQRIEILKGLQQKEDKDTLLLTALEIIGMLTGDNTYYTTAKEYLEKY